VGAGNDPVKPRLPPQRAPAPPMLSRRHDRPHVSAAGS
jgi:hypothetical protein